MIAIALAALAALAPQDDMPKPGKEHEWLKPLEGTWDVACKFHMDPSQAPMEMKGVETSKLDLGGFWLLSEFKGEMFGKPFEGRSTTGFSPQKKKFVGTWIDSMVPHLFVSEGELDAAGKVLTMIAEALDMATGKPTQERWVLEILDKDTHTFTFYGPGTDGKERKTGEMKYTRKK
jgi:hypothetical protein